MNFLKTFEKNLYGRDFVVSDLHGCYEAFQKELVRINFDPEIDRMFSVGDLVDRGPDSLSCLKLLEEKWFFPVKGNHEIMWVDAHKYWLRDFDPAYDDEINLKINCKIFFYNGGEIIEDLQTYLRFKKIIDKLPSIIEVNHRNGKKFGILHAELPTKFDDWNVLHELSDVEMEKTLGPSIYWGRSRYTSMTLMPQLVKNIDRIYVGHTIVDEVIDLGNIRYIDTGGFSYDGKLTVEVIK